MTLTKKELADLFYDSHFHETFNATVAIVGRQPVDLLTMAAEMDAEKFLVRHPQFWQGADPRELATTLACHLIERWLNAIGSVVRRDALSA